MYLHDNDSYYKAKYELANEVWIRTKSSWLYSTVKETKVTFQCKDYPEVKEVIANTGKITLKENCKLNTANTIIKSKKAAQSKVIEVYLPKVNIMLLQDKTRLENKTDRLKKIINLDELEYLKEKTKEIGENLENNQEPFFQQEQFIYPMATSSIIILITISIVIYFIIKKLKKRGR